MRNLQLGGQKTRWDVIKWIVFLILTFSYVSCFTSSILTYSYLNHGKFYKTSCSTDFNHSPLISATDVTLVMKMKQQLVEVVKMLLVMAGLETNPVPVSRTYLVHEPLTSGTAPPITIQCDDGALNGDFSIFSSYSRVFRELLTSGTTDCNQCKVIHLPGFSLTTVAHLVQLLTSGETYVTAEEKKRMVNLKLALSCSGVSRQDSVKVDTNQCKHCFRYVCADSSPTPTSFFPTSPTPTYPTPTYPIPTS